MNNKNIKTLTQTINILKHITHINKNIKKTKSDISYSKKKIQPQKGIGKARISTKKSPIFIGGARAFPPQKLKKHYKLNKKSLYKSIKIYNDNIKNQPLSTITLINKNSLTKTKHILSLINIKKNLTHRILLLITYTRYIILKKLIHNIKSLIIHISTHINHINILNPYKYNKIYIIN